MLVITPVYKEKDYVLKNNLNSVKNQDYKGNCSHLIIFDGVDYNKNIISKYSSYNENKIFYKTNFNHNDYGDYIRRLGGKFAKKRNFEAVTFLDADNYWDKSHLSTVFETHFRTKKDIIISSRKIIENNKIYSDDKPKSFFDTNLITLFNDKVEISKYWGLYHQQLSLIGDRIFSRFLKNNFSNDIEYTNRETVVYSKSVIPKERTKSFKQWHFKNYPYIQKKFNYIFGFDIII